jgi:hypothetical protein
MRKFARYKQDPRIITARFNSTCHETGKAIEKGQDCVYYPYNKSVFHMDSKQASEFKSWQEDVYVLGHNY